MGANFTLTKYVFDAWHHVPLVVVNSSLFIRPSFYLSIVITTRHTVVSSLLLELYFKFNGLYGYFASITIEMMPTMFWKLQIHLQSTITFRTNSIKLLAVAKFAVHVSTSYTWPQTFISHQELNGQCKLEHAVLLSILKIYNQIEVNPTGLIIRWVT